MSQIKERPRNSNFPSLGVAGYPISKHSRGFRRTISREEYFPCGGRLVKIDGGHSDV